MIWKKLELTGWGRVSRAQTLAARPERSSELPNVLAADHPKALSIYGAGRSYGDSALNSHGHSCLTERLDRILSFDDSSGVVEVEPAVTFRRLMDVFLPLGWLFPVTPGTSFATIGGAVAHDVHGKNHEKTGSFGQHVTEIEIIAADGTRHRVSPANRPEWFRATCGGCGLTGVISRIAFRLRRVPSAHVTVAERRLENLDAFLDAFEQTKDASYSVGWIDGLATGRGLGRGILETAEPAPDAGFASTPANAPSVPIGFPSFALNRLSVTAFNELYFRRIPKQGRHRVESYGRFLYPLDGIHHWNRIYGKAGFHQFQCAVPYVEGPTALRRLLQATAASGAASFLSVIKRLGPGRTGYLSFPMPGYTLAIDFPNRPGTEELYRALVAITLDHGGRIYLAKDALLSAEAFARMYPELPEFRRVLAEIDPGACFGSDLARRLDIRGAA
jgi:decaprenylphospho-beta-D-ribofuranose 2-oxidase